MKYWHVILSLFFLATDLPAQENRQELRLTLQECIEIALTNNATIERSKTNVALAEVSVDNVRNQFLPRTSLSWSLSHNVSGPREGRILDPATNVLIESLGEEIVSSGQSVGMGGLFIPLYDGRLLANFAASKKRLHASHMNQIADKNLVTFNVKLRYYELLKAIKLYEVGQEQLKVNQESLRMQETLFQLGHASQINLTNAKSQVAAQEVNLMQRENQIFNAQSNLVLEIGLDSDAEITPIEERVQISPPKTTYAEAIETALASHPSILADKYGMLASRDNFQATKRGLTHPTIRLRAGGFSWSLSQSDEFDGLEDIFLKNYSYGFGISASIPVLDMNTHNQLKSQKINYHQSQNRLDETKRQKRIFVKRTYKNIERLARLINANEVAIILAEESAQLAQVNYDRGGGTFLELLIAQSRLFQSRANLVSAQYDYLIQMASLENETGISQSDSSNNE